MLKQVQHDSFIELFPTKLLIKTHRLFLRNKSDRIPIKKVPEGTSLNGASNGINFEPYCVKLAHYLIHDEYSINTIKTLLQLE